MTSRSKTKFPTSIFGRMQFFDKINAYILNKMTEATVEEKGFWPVLPDLLSGSPASNLDIPLSGSTVPPIAQSISQQVISTWLFGYGFHWLNSFNSGPGQSMPHNPFGASANAHVFPTDAQTGFFLANKSANYNIGLNPDLCNPFAAKGRVMSYQEALFYYTPRGLRAPQRVTAFNEADSLLESYTRQNLIPLFLSSTSAIPENDLIAMGIRSRRRTHKNPYPVPQIEPTVDIINGRNHNIKVTVTETSEGGVAKSMVSTPGIKGCRIDWRFASDGEGAADEGNEWRSIYSTRFKEWIIFDEADARRAVEIRAAFLNPRLQGGPVSKVVIAVIT